MSKLRMTLSVRLMNALRLTFFIDSKESLAFNGFLMQVNGSLGPLTETGMPCTYYIVKRKKDTQAVKGSGV